jgi:deoxyribose-phosphate aldolase
MARKKQVKKETEQTEPSPLSSIDIQCTGLPPDTKLSVILANEHGFRGICITSGMLGDCKSEYQRNSDVNGLSGVERNKKLFTPPDNPLVITSVIDAPFGSLATPVRTNAIETSKLLGAHEVEIAVQMDYLTSATDCMYKNDIAEIARVAAENSMPVRICLDGGLVRGIISKRTIAALINEVKNAPFISFMNTSEIYRYDHISLKKTIQMLSTVADLGGTVGKVNWDVEDKKDIAILGEFGPPIVGVSVEAAIYVSELVLGCVAGETGDEEFV